MSKKKDPAQKEALYRVRYFDANWEEHVVYSCEGSMGKVMQEVAMWLRARERDKRDEDCIVHTLLGNFNYVSIEVIHE